MPIKLVCTELFQHQLYLAISLYQMLLDSFLVHFKWINDCPQSDIRDRIWEKPASTHTTSRHTFHHQTIVVHYKLRTIKAGIDAESFPGWFCCGLFLRLVRHPRVFRLPSTRSVSPWKADRRLYSNSPHEWLISLAMDLAALCDMWRWKWHQWMLFDWFSENVTFVHHFVAPRPPPHPSTL